MKPPTIPNRGLSCVLLTMPSNLGLVQEYHNGPLSKYHQKARFLFSHSSFSTSLIGLPSFESAPLPKKPLSNPNRGFSPIIAIMRGLEVRGFLLPPGGAKDRCRSILAKYSRVNERIKGVLCLTPHRRRASTVRGGENYIQRDISRVCL